MKNYNKYTTMKIQFKTVLFLLFSVSLLVSCGGGKDGEIKPTLLSNLVSITDNEDKGVKEILKYYGGYCEYSIGVSASIPEGKSKYFELKLSKSEAVEGYQNLIKMPASNMAYLFYKNLKEERENYSEIRTVIVLKNGREVSSTFTKEELQEVVDRIPTAEQALKFIKGKDFKAVETLIENESFYNYNKADLITQLEKIDPEFGEVTGYLPYGFRFLKTKEGGKILHLAYMVSRDINSHEFSVDFDMSGSKDKILKLDYNF